MNSSAPALFSAPTGMAISSPPANDELEPSLPGIGADAEVDLRVLERADREGAERRHPDLAARERRGLEAAVVRLDLRRHHVRLPHLAVERERVRDLGGVERRAGSVLRDDVAPAGPDVRGELEDVAAAAGAGEREAVGVGADRPDLLRVVDDLRVARRRLVGVEPRLLEQVLVVVEDRRLGGEGQRVGLAVVLGEPLVRRAQVVLVGQAAGERRDVLERALGREVGEEHQVDRGDVRGGARGGRGAELLHELRRRDDAHLRLRLVGLVVGVGQFGHERLLGVAGPDRDRAGGGSRGLLTARLLVVPAARGDGQRERDEHGDEADALKH